MLRSTCLVSNCRTHEFTNKIPEYLNSINGHFNCTTEHSCLECLDCPDCKNGKAYHSSIHGKYIKPARKTKVVLTDAQKQEIKTLSLNGASTRDLASQFNVNIKTVGNILRKS